MVLKFGTFRLKINIEREVFCLFINSVMIIDLIRIFTGNTMVTNLCRNVIYLLILFFVCMDACNKKMVNNLLGMGILYIVFALFSLLVNGSDVNSLLLSGSMIFISRCLVGFYLARNIQIDEGLWNSIKKYYVLVIVYCIVYANMGSLDQYGMREGYMTFSYNILIPTTLILIMMIQRKQGRVLKLIISTFLTIQLIVMGARGPVACMAVSIIIFIWIQLAQFPLYKKLIACGAFSLAAILVYFARDEILDYMLSINSTSRTLILLKNGNLFDLSNRNSYYEILIEEIKRNIILPHGLYADRVILNQNFSGSSAISGQYAHNLFFEILYQFGGVFGGAILFAFFIKVYKSIKHLELINNQIITAFYCAFATGLISLLFSSSYLINERAWLFIGIVFAFSNIKYLTLKSNG